MYNEDFRKRFWERVSKKSHNECWEWTASITNGYGQLRHNYVMKKSHRVSWELENGKIHDGLFVCHKCNNPACVNPKHLYLGTHYDNMQHRKLSGNYDNRGTKNAMSKLTENDVLEILRELEMGEKTQVQIGKDFCVTSAMISNISTGRAWRHIDRARKNAR